MSSFLNIRSSRPEVSRKKGVLKVKILQNSLKNIRDAFFNLINFRLKVRNFIEETLTYAPFVERRNFFEISAKNQHCNNG